MTTLSAGRAIHSDENLSSIAKAARVLRSLAEAGGSDVGVTSVALHAGLPKSTTHRVLAELMAEGLVGRNGQRYCLGHAWFELQSALSSSEWVRLVEQARQPLARLFERTNATIHFGVLDEEEVLYLEKLTARGGTVVPTRVGGTMPAVRTALGKCLLAYSSVDVIRSVMSKPLPQVSRGSIVLPRVLLQQFADIRRTGLSYDVHESQPGVLCVAAPVAVDDRVVAAVSITRVYARALAPTDARDVLRTAQEISEWLA
ncbi:IclR family transcriptional regulator [Micromonospora olivasterospora]|uniref:IclR family transcriptional regulator n=1 Tax=Micromonospora olivasterospora TaxID=1880 RepID=A0A562I3P0_MICOL|nr:IclR family transcriptional regulator [Micromonospora olivasterospora]TWH65314.1 IclR family transcriptional regulator [Micromonospora olivasterospora]